MYKNHQTFCQHKTFFFSLRSFVVLVIFYLYVGNVTYDFSFVVFKKFTTEYTAYCLSANSLSPKM